MRLTQKQQIMIVALSLATAAFIVNFILASKLGDLRAVDQYDVLFNADTGARIECMVNNECGGRSSFSHPNLAFFLNPPVQATAWILTRTGVCSSDEADVRRSIALVLSPLASAAKAAVVFLLFVLLGLAVSRAALLSVLCLVSFTQLVFGSLPEAFALSGVLIALAYLLAVHSMRSGDRRLWPWIILGILTAGITVSNIVIILILFVAAALYNKTGIRSIVTRTALLVACVVIPTAVLPPLFSDTYNLKEIGIKGGSEYTTRWMIPGEFADRALKTPVTWSHTFAAPAPETVSNGRAIRDRSKYRFRFTLSPPNVFLCRNPLSLFLILVFVAGAMCLRHVPRMVKWVYGASLAVVGFNWALHSVWGVDLFLYSQHWHLSLAVLLAGPFLLDRPLVRKIAACVVIVVIIAVIVQNSGTWAGMLTTLESVPDHASVNLTGETWRF